MKKEEILPDSLLKEYHENGLSPDTSFVNSVLDHIDEGREAESTLTTQKSTVWPRYMAASLAVLATTGMVTYLYHHSQPKDTIAMHQTDLHENDNTTLNLDEEPFVKESPASISEINSQQKVSHNHTFAKPPSPNLNKAPITPSNIPINPPVPTPNTADIKPEKHFGPSPDSMIDGLGAASSSFEREKKMPLSKKEIGRSSGSSAAHSPALKRRKILLETEATDKNHGDRYGVISDNEPILTNNKDSSTFSVDVDTASYTQLRKSLNSKTKPHPDSVRIEEMINYFSYDYPQPKEDQPFSISVEKSACPWNSEHRLVKIGLQGKAVENDDRKPANLVFLIDTSGSMAAPDKLPLLQSSLNKLVQTMNAKDSISIVTYAGNSGVALAPTRVTEKNKSIISSVLQDIVPEGSTNGESGIQLAYRLASENMEDGGVSRIILATDGDFNVGVANSAQLTQLVKEKAKEGVEISVLGFGSGNLNDQMLESITNNGNGNYNYIDTDAEAYRVLVKNIGGTLETIAKDVKVQAIFNKETVHSYRLIGYANRNLKNEDFANDKIDAGEIGAGHSVTAIYQIELAEEAQKGAPLMEVKLRYKKPKGNDSSLITKAVKNQFTRLDEASKDMNFSSSIALFGMIIRDSKWKNDGNMAMVTKLAKQGLSSTDKEAKLEFLKLIGSPEAGLEKW